MNIDVRDLNQISVNTYNCCAQAYEQRFMDITPYKISVDEFCNQLTSFKDKILDLGCGPGNYSRYISTEKGYSHIHGIDLSEEMIHIARKHVPQGTFQVADIRKFNDLDETYQGIVASFCIPYLSYRETNSLIQKIAKLLRPSGILYISCMEGEEAGFEKTSFSGEMAVYIYYYTEKFLVAALEVYGFKVISLRRQAYNNPDGTILTDMIFIAQKTLE